MKLLLAEKLFPETGGVVIGERYRVDRDSTASQPFRAGSAETWGAGGKSPLLCFYGSSHGIVFAGSGGFKTTSVTIPTALTWGAALVVLDPSNEVAPIVSKHRGNANRDIFVLDPKTRSRLDRPLRRNEGGGYCLRRIVDYKRQRWRPWGSRRLLPRLGLAIAHRADCRRLPLRPHDGKRPDAPAGTQNLSEAEPKLRKRLQEIYDDSSSDFVKENVAAFVNMTPETFSGVYANAVKETHWLSYANYAALVSETSFTTGDLADGKTDVDLNLI